MEIVIYPKDQFIDRFNNQWVAWLEQCGEEIDANDEIEQGNLAFWKGSDYHIYAVFREDIESIAIYRFSTMLNRWIAARDSLLEEAKAVLTLAKTMLI